VSVLDRTRLIAAGCFTVFLLALFLKGLAVAPWTTAASTVQWLALIAGTLALVRPVGSQRLMALRVIHFLLVGMSLIPVVTMAMALSARQYLTAATSLLGLTILVGGDALVRKSIRNHQVGK